MGRPGGVGASRRSDGTRRAGGARTTGRPGRPRCFPSGHKNSAGEAGTNERPRRGKDLWPPGASAARGRLREPTKRRRLTKPGGTPPGRADARAGPEVVGVCACESAAVVALSRGCLFGGLRRALSDHLAAGEGQRSVPKVTVIHRLSASDRAHDGTAASVPTCARPGAHLLDSTATSRPGEHLPRRCEQLGRVATGRRRRRPTGWMTITVLIEGWRLNGIKR